MSSTAFMSVVPDAIQLSTQLAHPEVLLRSLWKAFLVLLQEGYGLRAVSFAKELSALHPSAIPPSYYTDLLLALLRHREVKLAHDLLEHCGNLHPDMAPSWKELVTYQSARQGASRLAIKLTRTGGIGNRLRWQAASSSRSAGRLKGAIFLSFRLWEQYDKTSSPSVASSALQLFIRLQRIAATWRLYERICRQESRDLRRSPARRARTVVSVYKTLIEKHGFTPDRVTLNILLKALLLSKTFNARQVRALFDALVRLGYPNGVDSVEGDHAAPAGVFGTPVLQRPSIAGLELSSFTTTPMLYVRHVRPLYKTFIKAFYLLGDVHAAMTVIGIKKALETSNMSRLAKGLDCMLTGPQRDVDVFPTKSPMSLELALGYGVEFGWSQAHGVDNEAVEILFNLLGGSNADRLEQVANWDCAIDDDPNLIIDDTADSVHCLRVVSVSTSTRLDAVPTQSSPSVALQIRFKLGIVPSGIAWSRHTNHNNSPSESSLAVSGSTRWRSHASEQNLPSKDHVAIISMVARCCSVLYKPRTADEEPPPTSRSLPPTLCWMAMVTKAW
ncbi:hypothetical protein NUW54_g11239 [Trametes sanguinea]|uniref:Uncharacterized protein n=1 Tax=Trametes sanguinea TaxID=158606 RepID=A0ACC1NHP0_9APHY|nr:hypothetical protein NUW54_g11239 [Trametes sanguinea]